ncbi:hypothetical protein RCL1_008930 [Eukaryota sp. TZLM3-RCL]
MAQFQAFEQALQQYLFGQSSGLYENLPVAVKSRVHTLKRNQSEIDEVYVKMRKAIAELTVDFEKQLSPLIEERSKIINGEVEPSDADVEEAKKETQVEEISSENEDESEQVPQGIPDFWSVAIRNAPLLSHIAEDFDNDVIDALTNIEYSTIANENIGFKLILSFKDNSVFGACTVSKVYIMSSTDESCLDSVFLEGEIPWKYGKKEAVPEECFTRFLIPPVIDEADENKEEAMEALEFHYEVSQVLKEIVMNPVPYFCGEVDKMIHDGMDSDEDEEDFEDEDEEEDQDDDDEDEEEAGDGKESCNNQ